MKKKIILLNHNYQDVGTFYRVKNIAKTLSSENEIIILCASGKKIDFKIRKKKIEKNITLITLPVFRYSKFFSGQFIRLFITIFILLIIKFDLLYSFAFSQPQISIPSVLIKIIRRPQLIVDWDDLWGNGLGKQHNTLINKIFIFNENYLTKFADSITCASVFLTRYSKKKFNKKKIIYLPNFNVKVLSFNSLRDRNYDNRFCFLIIANTFTKAIIYYLKLFEKINHSIKIELKIVGSNERDFQKDFGKDFFKDQIKFYGKIYDEKKKQDIIDSSDVLIMPTEPNKFERSRSPIKFIEYLSMGKPIITNNFGEPARYLKKYKSGLILSGNINKDHLMIEGLIKNYTSYSPLLKSYYDILKKLSLDNAKRNLNNIINV